MMTNEELDMLVGDKVMGWTHKPGVEGRWYDGENLVATEDWRPSVEIADAWMVVQKIKSQTLGPARNYPDFGILDESTPKRGFYWAYFDGWVDDTRQGGSNVTSRAESYSNTLPRAICFAALRCVGAIGECDNRTLD